MFFRMKQLNDTCRKLTFVIVWSVYLCFITAAAEIDATLDYEIEGDGFHRTIRYRIEFGNFFRENCHVALHLSPDPTLYVNIDELADLQRRGEKLPEYNIEYLSENMCKIHASSSISSKPIEKLKLCCSETTKLVYEHNKIIRIFHLNAPKSIACSEGEIDVELFAENANRQNITVCGQLKKSNNLLSLPLHQRYRLPQENDLYINVTLAEPTLLLGCKERIKEYGVSEIDLCAPCVDLSLKWRQIPYRMEKEKYIWSVAVGDLSDLEYVTNGTLLTVTIGTLWILRVLWSSRRDKGDKKD